jgi:hypothetical protein
MSPEGFSFFAASKKIRSNRSGIHIKLFILIQAIPEEEVNEQGINTYNLLL